MLYQVFFCFYLKKTHERKKIDIAFLYVALFLF